MQVLNIVTWLQTVITCDTIISNKAVNVNNKALVVKSEEPWALLKLYTDPIPSNCVVLLLDNTDDFLESMSHVKKHRVRVTYVLTLALNSSVHNLNLPYIHNEVHIVQLDKQKQVKGHKLLTPYTKDGLSKNRHVSIAYTILYPYVTSYGSDPQGSDIELVETLSKSLGFTYEYVYDKYFQGLIRNVWSEQADFCISHPAIALHRYSFGLDIFALSARRYVLIQRHPIDINKVYTITTPFTLHVWLAIFFTSGLIGVLLAIMNRCGNVNGDNAFNEITLACVPLVSKPHAGYSSQQHNSYFILLFVWLLLGSLLSQCYESNLRANLIKVEKKKQPKTLQEAYDSKIALYVTEKSVMTIFLRDSPIEIHRRLYTDNVQKRGGSYGGSLIPPPDIFEKIVAGEAYGFQIEDGLVVNKHKFHAMEEEVTWGPSGWYFFLHLPIAHEILDAIIRFRDAGVVKKITDGVNWRLSKDWREMKLTSKDNEAVIIGLSHTFPMLAILAIGFFIALICHLVQLGSGEESTKTTESKTVVVTRTKKILVTS